jgi:hypothetical protein
MVDQRQRAPGRAIARSGERLEIGGLVAEHVLVAVARERECEQGRCAISRRNSSECFLG